MKFVQQVLLQNREEKIQLASNNKSLKTSSVTGQALVKDDGSGSLEGFKTTNYRLGTAISMCIVQWSRPEAYNTTPYCARQVSVPRLVHKKALQYLLR